MAASQVLRVEDKGRKADSNGLPKWLPQFLSKVDIVGHGKVSLVIVKGKPHHICIEDSELISSETIS